MGHGITFFFNFFYSLFIIMRISSFLNVDHVFLIEYEYNAAFAWISCPLCRHFTEIELPNNLYFDVEFLRLVAERRSLKEIIVRKDEACNNQLLQIANLQQQVDLCRDMHGERVRMSSPASSVTIPLENAASAVIVEPQPSTSGTTNERKSNFTFINVLLSTFTSRVILLV
jgi:Na+-translocating ferredoxin:NAD+ oxidoreductase RnfC subunit